MEICGTVQGNNLGILPMSDLDDFMAENKPTFRSKLQPYLSDIQTLWQHGYSEPDILRYLSEKKMLVVTRKTLHAFIVKNIRQTVSIPQTVEHPEPKSIHQGKTVAQSPSEAENAKKQAENVPNESVQTNPRPQIKKGIKKFDWKNATTDGLV